MRERKAADRAREKQEAADKQARESEARQASEDVVKNKLGDEFAGLSWRRMSSADGKHGVFTGTATRNLGKRTEKMSG